MSGALGNLCPSDESSVATAGQIWYIRDFPLPVGSVTNVSLGSLRHGHYGLQTTVIHGGDLVRDLLRMLDSTWVL